VHAREKMETADRASWKLSYFIMDDSQQKLISELEAQNVTSLPTLSAALAEHRYDADRDTLAPYLRAVSAVRDQFHERFSELRNEKVMFLIRLFHNPFDVDTASLPENLRFEHIRLRSSMDLRSLFHPLPQERLHFWKVVFRGGNFPAISNSVLRIMTHFGTTYRCESAFSFLKFVKDRFRSRIRDDVLQEFIRLHVTTYKPCIDTIVEAMQVHSKKSKK
jgi:hypothetical protein